MGGKSSDPNKAAMKAQKAQMARLDKLSLPELEEYVLQNPDLVGLLDTEEIGKSSMEEISLDPAMREKQMQALNSLQQQADEGITDVDKYQMEQLLGDVASQEQSRQKAIENQMAAQGMDSSGAALQAKLQSKQSSANDARDKAMQMAAQGQQNRMQALQALGQQAGQMESTDYGRQANLASARDTISKYNAQNRQNVNQMNLAARQGIENQRANTANQQAQVGNQIAQQRFNNEYSKTGAQGNVANAMSNIAGNTPAKPSAFQSALGGASTGAGVGASFGPAGAGIGAGIGAAAGLLGGLEDGGIIEGGVPRSIQDTAAESEAKQKAAFKKKYMKNIHDEIMGDTKPAYNAGGLVSNRTPEEEAVLQQLNATRRVNPNTQDFDAAMAGKPVDSPMGFDTSKATEINRREAGSTMETSEKKPEESASGMKGLTEGLAALNSLMGSKEQAKKPLRLESNAIEAPKNIMSPVQAQQFGNPFAAADGGMPRYASDGMGDIIDSGMESYADDRVDAKVNDGEAILNVPQQQRFMDLVRGKISLTELGDDDIVEGVPRDYRDDLHEKIDNESAGQDEKMKGLEKLITLLGK